MRSSEHNAVVAVVVPDQVKFGELAHSMKRGWKEHEDLCKDPVMVKEMQRLITEHAKVFVLSSQSNSTV